MDPNRTFSKEEVSKILSMASKIQNRKDLNQDKLALTVEDLQHIAEEVGIDRNSLDEAIRNAGTVGQDESFNWLGLSSTLHKELTLQGEMDDEAWEDFIQDVRKITGYIGKAGMVGKAYEWEQPESDTGVEKLFSLSPQQDSTKVRFFAQWRALEIISIGFSAFAGAGLGMFFINLLQTSGATLLTFPIVGALSVFGISRLIMKWYYDRQKTQYDQMVAAVEKSLRRSGARKTMLDELEHEQEQEQGQERGQRRSAEGTW